MSDYLADGVAVSEEAFVRLACDPRRSAVVEACAGSGKTWLLVGRIVRALLDGSAPGEILAITFTRRAAQEMRTRLLDELKRLALASDEAIVAWLRQRGLDESSARASIGAARQLYERVAMARVPISMETFHGWFWQLVSRAPLGAGVPYAPALLETVDRLRTDAWLHFTARLLEPAHAAERAAWVRLIDDLGDASARQVLMKLLDRRAEWWCFAAGDEAAAVERALAPLRTVGERDPRAGIRAADVVEAVRTLADTWASLTRPLQTAQQALERARQWLATEPTEAAADFYAASLIVLTRSEQTPTQALLPGRIAARLRTVDEVDRYAQAHGLVVGRLEELKADLRTWQALRLNEAALACGRLLIDAYQRLKAQQQALDFTDLEWHAHRLLADPDHAAYMQARLDARYRHILVDEFQDTNPLQWQVLQAWLEAYGEREDEAGADDRPRVFIVGDPKQSIYRFRRAEPRVFDAARALLARDFGAVQLRTNVTRRNRHAIVEVLNRVMAANPLFQPQSTRAADGGAFVLLPLSAPLPPPAVDAAALRDVLATPRPERDSDSRYREGRVLANELAHWVAHTRVRDGEGERAARWSDVLLLVRRRTYLPQIDRALRDAGVPYVSDRRGGLLATLEADDLLALLVFLTTPTLDLKLAHALRSPIFGAADADLVALAQQPGASWWQRLLALAAASAGAGAPDADAERGGQRRAGAAAGAGAPGPGTSAEPALARAARLLARWLDAARVLPVHDLLDRIYFEGDLRRRYAAAVPAPMQAQVQANLDAFIELALDIDAGRYPSLPRFIDELAGLKRHAPEEAPDEGLADSGDAVRVMTIHGAKGLEAEIVAIADAHSRPAADGESVLVVWPPTEPAPAHVSVVARGAQGRDDARAGWFADDDAQRAQEDWNLLYVAATRARQVLIVSGSSPAGNAPAESWYTRMQAVESLSVGAALPQPPPAPPARAVRDFLPAPMPTGCRIAEAPQTEAQRLGLAWHAALERGAGAESAIARAYDLSPAQAEQVAAAAARVRERLPQFFGAGALAEVELVDADGSVLRVDRLAEHDGALWIVDFKWKIGAAERPQYEEQVRRYARVLRAIRRDKPVRLGLITAAGELIEVAA
jgi:ATP-dependent helicase/nuclease subunit A